MIRSCPGHRGLKSISARLRELDGGHRPLAMVASDRDSQAVHFVKPNALHRTGLAVGEDHGLADEPSLGLIELAEDGGCTYFRGGGAPISRTNGARQREFRWLGCLADLRRPYSSVSRSFCSSSAISA